MLYSSKIPEEKNIPPHPHTVSKGQVGSLDFYPHLAIIRYLSPDPIPTVVVSEKAK